jgi:cell division septum initiation protein DivIVA
MEYNAISNLEQELLRVLKEEYSFYQSLYILIDKQRDLLKFEKEDKLLEVYTEIERCHKRILESEQKVTALRRDNPKLFNLAASAPEVKKVAQCIMTLIRKNLELVKENEEYATNRHDRLKEALKELQQSTKIVRYIRDLEVAPQFVDKKN